jgi:radical SAM protein with 4Fe4S-binding SPASM domain
MPRPSSEPVPAPPEPMSDAVLIEPGEQGGWRYFRAEDPAREEYTYRKPFILELELTRRCNLRCVHCYAGADDRAFADELSLAELGRVLGEGHELGMRELSLTGGEVLLHADFLRVVDGAIDRGYAVRFVTNATLVDAALARELGRRAVKLVTVSLDGASAMGHEAIRGPGTHVAAVAGIERLLEAGLQLSIITAFSRLNIAEFDDLRDFCVRHDVAWQVQMTSAKGRCPHPITFSPEEYYALGERVARAIAAGPGIPIIAMDDLATYSHFPPLDRLGATWKRQCVGGILNIFVRASGEVTPCSALCFPECVVGNVRRESLGDICRQERCRHALAWLSADTLSGECASCPFKAECQGGCPEILISMCSSRTENEYCFHRIEQRRILNALRESGAPGEPQALPEPGSAREANAPERHRRGSGGG